MFRRWFRILGLFCFLSCGASSASAAIAYTVIDLGTLGSGEGRVSEVGPGGLNSRGQVAGWSSGGTNVGIRAFRWSAGTMIDLGSLGGTATWAYGINASGQIVGASYTSGGLERAFLYSGGALNSLPGLAITGWSCAFGIGDNGKIVGTATNSQGVQSPVVWNNGFATDLGGLGGYSAAKSINSHDQIAGYSMNGSGRYHAVMWSGGSRTDLGSLPGWSNSWVWDLNDNGQIVGESFNTYGSLGRGYIWSGGVFTQLATFGGTYSRASAINNHGQVVGLATDSSGTARPFLYQSGAMTDLNTLIDPASGWTLNSAEDINDSGMICGNARNSLGQSHAYLLVPVPEPSTIALLLTASVGGLLWWRRRK